MRRQHDISSGTNGLTGFPVESTRKCQSIKKPKQCRDRPDSARARPPDQAAVSTTSTGSIENSENETSISRRVQPRCMMAVDTGFRNRASNLTRNPRHAPHTATSKAFVFPISPSYDCVIYTGHTAKLERTEMRFNVPNFNFCLVRTQWLLPAPSRPRLMLTKAHSLRPEVI